MLEDNGIRSNQSIALLTQALAEIEDQLIDLQKSLAQKISGDSEGGSNIVVKLKDAILQLQKEIHEMHINSVFANEELIDRQKSQLYYLNNKRKMQVKKRGKSITATIDDDISL
jgi:N-acetylglutamate synthase/N-acetylornithine aminotransferase